MYESTIDFSCVAGGGNNEKVVVGVGDGYFSHIYVNIAGLSMIVKDDESFSSPFTTCKIGIKLVRPFDNLVKFSLRLLALFLASMPGTVTCIVNGTCFNNNVHTTERNGWDSGTPYKINLDDAVAAVDADIFCFLS